MSVKVFCGSSKWCGDEWEFNYRAISHFSRIYLHLCILDRFVGKFKVLNNSSCLS